MPRDRLRGSITMMRFFTCSVGLWARRVVSKEDAPGVANTRRRARSATTAQCEGSVSGVGNLRRMAWALGGEREPPSLFSRELRGGTRIGRTSRTKKAEQPWAFGSRAEVCDLGIAAVVLVAQPNKRYIKRRPPCIPTLNVNRPSHPRPRPLLRCPTIIALRTPMHQRTHLHTYPS